MTKFMHTGTTPEIAISKQPVFADDAAYIRRRRVKLHGKGVATWPNMPLTEMG